MSKLIVETIAVAIAAMISAAIWAVRRKRARQRLRQIESGTRCVSCDGTELERAGEAARCMRCGYVASLTRIAAVRVNQNDVDDLVKPEGFSA